ncbi:hypothetical protein [Paenibacillus sp. SI92]|uniref:hypothetical protein n=1 Tax=Paenibacillus sp. SI92 TaxID=3163027 RepID=UPI003464F1DC
MREIDINHVMNQLGISSVDFMNWQAEQEKLREEESSCILDTPVDMLTDLLSDSSIEFCL